MTEASESNPAPQRPRPGPPKWETEARERLKAKVRSMTRPLQGLLERDANEGDTRHFVTDFLCDALGYDKYEDLSTEYLVKGEFADYGLRIDKQLCAFVEVKRVATKLGPKHLRQVEAYAINEGVDWGILTNGNDWQVYHLAPRSERGPSNGPLVEVDLTLEVALLGDEPPARKLDKLFYLSKAAMQKKKPLDELWKQQRATSPRSIGQAICSEVVIEALRKELWRRTGHRAEANELERVLVSAVLRPEALDQESALPPASARRRGLRSTP